MKNINGGQSKEMQPHHYPILYEVEETHWWYVGRRRLIQTFVEEILRDLKIVNPAILDVGCGTGANLKLLSKYGMAEGVDISEQALTFCRQRGLECVRRGSIEDLPYEDSSFDLVTALDVIEHLDDDLVGLQEVRRVLRPHGRVLIFVPTFMFLWGVQDEVSNHRRRYTLSKLQRVVTAAGLTVDRASYANFTFFVPVFLARKMMRLLHIRTETEYSVNIPALNHPLSRIFAAERFILRHKSFPFGVSAFCVAHRAG